MLPPMWSHPPCMNMLVSSVSQMGTGPGSCGMLPGLPIDGDLGRLGQIRPCGDLVRNRAVAIGEPIPALPAALEEQEDDHVDGDDRDVAKARPWPGSFSSPIGNMVASSCGAIEVGAGMIAPPWRAIIAAMSVRSGPTRAPSTTSWQPCCCRSPGRSRTRTRRFSSPSSSSSLPCRLRREPVVATAGAFSFSLTVPGGELPMAGVTMVGSTPPIADGASSASSCAVSSTTFSARRAAGGPLGVGGPHLQRFGYGLGTLGAGFAVDARDRRSAVRTHGPARCASSTARRPRSSSHRSMPPHARSGPGR